MVDFSFASPFDSDERGNKLKAYSIDDYHEEKSSGLLLCGPEEVATQLVNEYEQASVVVLSEDGKSQWTHGIYFRGGVPREATILCDFLKSWLSIPCSENIDLSISLDWYSQPEAAGGVARTPTGQLINRTKHASHPTWSQSKISRAELVSELSGLINNHPTYTAADFITSPPGSGGDGQSFAELLAQEVARQTHKPYIAMCGPARPQQKEEVSRTVRDDFEMSSAVSGTAIVLDDVFRSGITLESAAVALRNAGADKVLALSATRTIRK